MATARRTDERGPVIITATTLTISLGVIVLLALVLPPVAATRVQQTRLARATAQLATNAAAFDGSCIAAASDGGALANVDVLVGPGVDFERAADSQWLSTRIAALAACVRLSGSNVEADPWLRPLVVNLGAIRRGGTARMLTAGPNGIIDTPFQFDATVGDDLAVPLAGPGAIRDGDRRR
jgi:hypothetical protein